jgi:uncharacterized protein (DUF1810 family)
VIGFNLERFLAAQAPVYDQALAELRAGRKESHWMWFIFPQLAGLGRSATARFFAIVSADEARAYLAHPLLGGRLAECVEATLGHGDRSADAIFGSVDAMKFRSSLTLFEAAAAEPQLFASALDLFYSGSRDPGTLKLLRG